MHRDIRRSSEAASAARCTASRASAANAGHAFSNCTLADIAGRHMRVRTRTTWTTPPLSGPNQDGVCGWRAAKQARFFHSTCCLEEPRRARVAEPADYDLETGRLNPNALGPRMRRVYLRHDRITPPIDEDGDVDHEHGSARSVHALRRVRRASAASGAPPFRTTRRRATSPSRLSLREQIQIQPPGPVEASRFAPLRGRKVLVFSDSRQVAARLAPNLQMYSVRDSLRPLIAWGYRRLQSVTL